mmetsp:Transcript_72784/g.236397  ORF Transcript_72784/g.236397 Transcript_72784/m.236397 type:complete len:229 (-) Transcript_72784:88-774(-)
MRRPEASTPSWLQGHELILEHGPQRCKDEGHPQMVWNGAQYQLPERDAEDNDAEVLREKWHHQKPKQDEEPERVLVSLEDLQRQLCLLVVPLLDAITYRILEGPTSNTEGGRHAHKQTAKENDHANPEAKDHAWDEHDHEDNRDWDHHENGNASTNKDCILPIGLVRHNVQKHNLEQSARPYQKGYDQHPEEEACQDVGGRQRVRQPTLLPLAFPIGYFIGFGCHGKV